MLKAKIRLWDNNHKEISTCDVLCDINRFADTNDFVARCWETADNMALNLTPSDEWGMEMTITCDFTTPVRRKKK